MGIFDDVLAEAVADPADREVLAGMGKKYPGLEKSVLAQREFSRKLNEFTTKEAGFRDTEAQLTAWETWREQNWDGDAKMTKAQKSAYDRLSASEQKVAELTANQGTGNEMTFDEIQQNLVKEGYVKKGDVEAMAKSLNLVDSNAMVTGFGNQAVAFEHVFTKVTPLLRKYEREFNEDMDLEKFYKEISTPEGIKDIPAVYEKFVAGKRAQNQVAAAEQKVKDLEQQFEKKKTELNSGGQPTDNGSGAPMGHLQSRIMKQADGSPHVDIDSIKAPLGGGTIAAAIAADYAKSHAGNS